MPDPATSSPNPAGADESPSAASSAASAIGRFARVVSRLRGTRSGPADNELAEVGPDLSDDDLALLRTKVDQAISPSSAPEAARARVAEIGAAYLLLSDVGKIRFFDLLASSYGIDEDAVSAALKRRSISSTDDLVLAEIDAQLRQSLEPARVRLFRYFSGLDNGVKFLVDLRADVRRLRNDADSPGSAANTGRRILDGELRDLLSSWFDIGLLQLERITWSTSAEVLEKLIEYEAVHDITSWDHLKRRLAPDRRLYAFFHPGMPAEPLIFVEVALTVGISDAIEPLIDADEPVIDPDEADTAIFYSISNCQDGLAGVPLGDFLIKRVVAEVSHNLPGISVFSTLSPMPGFHRWVDEQIDTGGLRTDEQEVIALIATTDEWWTLDDAVTAAKPALTGLAARYLLSERSDTSNSGGPRVLDPVARFHLSNGARVERLLFLANPTAVGQQRGLGMMVNYRYVPDHLDNNQDAYLNRNEVVASDQVRELLGTGERA